jgi:hypothetical protein
VQDQQVAILDALPRNPCDCIHMASVISTLVNRILAEIPIRLAEAAPIVGTSRGGKPCHPSTLARWALRGVRRKDGEVIKLESI